MTENRCLEKLQQPVITIKHNHPILIDEDDNTRLHFAAAEGNKEDVLDYLKNDSKIVDVENHLGWTPLMMACRRGHEEVVACLLDNGANATKKNRFDMNVLLITVASGNVTLVQTILEHLLTGGISRRRLQAILSPISVAVLFHQRIIWEYLLTRHFDLDAATKITAVTPLMFATAMENSKAFMELLRAGSDATLKNCLGHTAFDIATLRKNLRNIANRLSQTAPSIVVHSPNVVHNVPNTAQHVPWFIISPHPPLLQIASPMFGPNIHVRKSSNISPFCFPPPPNVTPISPVAQAFFPPDFSPGHVFAHTQGFLDHSGLLNGRINSSEIFVSPQ